MSARTTLLVVEDDDDLRRQYRTALALAGFDVREAGDGLDAIASIDRWPPDLVVLDLHLPGVHGRVVVQELAAHPHTRDTPVVVVTGSPDPLPFLDVACILRKPVSPDELIGAVRRCVGNGGPAKF